MQKRKSKQQIGFTEIHALEEKAKEAKKEFVSSRAEIGGRKACCYEEHLSRSKVKHETKHEETLSVKE